MGMKLKVYTNYELEINSLDKFDYSPYNIFDNSLKIDEKKYRIEHLKKQNSYDLFNYTCQVNSLYAIFNKGK